MSTTDFDKFLATRPQLVRDSTPLPGLCHCPDRYSVDDRPILVRHSVCDNTPDSYAWVDLSNEGGPLMRSVDLDALAAWIPSPPPAPSLDPGLAVFVIRRMLALGFHLVRLHAGTKKPVGAGWNDPARTAALTEEEALVHVLEGGNLGVLLGPSNLIVVDAENLAAVQALKAAGLHPVLITAKGTLPVLCDPRIDKRGGGHAWLRVPESHRGRRLSNIPQAKVADGGLIDVLAAPGSMAVVPPTALIAAGGHRYVADGGHQVWHAEDVADAPEWLFDPAVECPAGLESLHGGLAERVRERGPVSESAAELSSDLDAVPWAEVLALDPQARLEDWGDEDPECGCTEVHFRGATHRRSAWLHECDRGTYAHFVSDTAMAALGLSQRTVSKAQLAGTLLGVPATGAGFRAVAKRLGVELSGPSLSFADQLDTLAEVYDEHVADPELCTGTVVIPDPSEAPEPVTYRMPDGEGGERVETRWRTSKWVAVPATAERWTVEADAMRTLARQLRGEQLAEGAVLIGADSVVGAPVQAVPTAEGEIVAPDNVVPLRVLPGGAGAQEPDNGEDDDDGDTDAPPAERVLDVVVREYRGVSPVEGQLMRYPMPEIPAHVKAVQGARTEWRKVRPPIANRHTEKHVQHEWIFSATPGLSQVAAAADARAVARWGMLASLLPRVAARIPATVRLIPSGAEPDDLPATPTTQGTAINVYSVAVSPPSSGKTVSLTGAAGLIPNVRTLPPGTGEGVLKEFPRVSPDDDDDDGEVPKIGQPGEDLSSLLLETDEIDIFVGEMMRQGSKTSGWYRSMWMGGEIGNTVSGADRRSFIAAHTYRFGILLGAQPDTLAPLFAETGRGTPQRFIWLPAQQSVKRGSYPERLQIPDINWMGTGPSMIPDMSGEKAPVWVYPPAAAEEAILRDTIAGATANPTEAPSLADPAGSIAANHATLNQLKICVLLAALDGLTQPQDVHWHCAGAIMAVRREMIYDLVAESKKVRAEAARALGDMNGLTQAAALASREAERAYHVQRCADAILRALVRDIENGAGPRTHAQAIKALDGHKRRGGFSDQQLFGADALAKVLGDERVFNSGTHVHFIGGRAA